MESLITVVLHRDEIVKHVRDAAWVYAKALMENPESKTERDDAWLIDVFETEGSSTDGNYSLGIRSMRYAMALCRQAVRKYAITEPGGVANCDELRDPEDYCVELLIDTKTPRTLCNTLAELMHRFVALTCLMEWMKLTAHQIPQNLQDEVDIALQNIKDACKSTTGGKNRPFWPAW